MVQRHAVQHEHRMEGEKQQKVGPGEVCFLGGMSTFFIFSYSGVATVPITQTIARIVLFQTFSVIANPNSHGTVTQIPGDKLQLQKRGTEPPGFLP